MEPISVTALTKRFGDLTALDGVGLEVREGEAVALLGENGAGKSTLLRILATAIIPDAGEVWIGGHDVLRAPTAARGSIGFLLADERSWYWRLTGRQNLEFFAALYGLGRPAGTARAAELLQLVGLGDSADRRFGEYSSGMRLRLSLARAVLSRPPILLLDEPTRSIDPIARIHFHDLLASFMETERVTLLLATHDLHEATLLARRCLFLAGGRIAGVTASWRDAADLQSQLLASVT
jgi:ABC-2 type transport system ATP-binding protein